MSESITDARLEALTRGHGLDTLGHRFEPFEIHRLSGVVWPDPDPDSVPWIRGPGGTARAAGLEELEEPLYVFVPSGLGVEFPELFLRPGDEEVDERQGEEPAFFRRVRFGRLAETERPCTCRRATEKGHPECPRCGGAGSVVSEGGSWALYARAEFEHAYRLTLTLRLQGQPPGEDAVEAVLEHSTARQALALGLGLEERQVSLCLEID